MLKYLEKDGRKVECGTNALNNVYVQPIKTWNDWKQTASQLCRKNELKEKFHSIAIDTSDEAWNLCARYVCSQAGVESLGDVPFGKLYDTAKKEFQQPFRDLAYNGYGLIFTSHSTFKKDKNEEYTQIVPALPPRPFDVINKMVDIIAYIKEESVDQGPDSSVRKRFMFLRDEVGDRFLAKSRYRYIKPKIELDYNELVNAIYEAIDKECERTGQEATNKENPYTTLNFDELMEEAKILWRQVIQKELTPQVNKILQNTFNKPIKFSEILPEDVDKLNQVLIAIRDLM